MLPGTLRRSNEGAADRGRSLVNGKLKLALAALVGAIAIGGIFHAPQASTQPAKIAPAYLVVEVDVKDPDTFRKYTTAIPETLAPFGGRFIVRGGKTDALEGAAPRRIIVVAFDSMEKARGWWDSPAYVAIRPIRHKSAEARLYFVEGVAP
jgi:uncharacterized protein (DUF1330 family)